MYICIGEHVEISNMLINLKLLSNKTIGLCPQDKILQDMVKEAPGQLNFTMFLSLFSEKLSGE